ncbi:MAG: archaellum stator protein ArlF [Candidatus Syntropharchaeales archaeon]|nr:hypothetical protein [Candidatus Syntrophoarchaeum sp.]
MGFSVSVTFAIFLVAFLALSSILVSSYDYRSNLIDDAKEIRQERMLNELQTDLEIVQTSYNPTLDILTIDVDNSGSITLDTDEIDVIVDGRMQTGNITSLLVDGADTTVWAPEETLEIKVSGIASDPTRIKVIAGNGVSDCYGT